jgi:hypothetical protein
LQEAAEPIVLFLFTQDDEVRAADGSTERPLRSPVLIESCAAAAVSIETVDKVSEGFDRSVRRSGRANGGVPVFCNFVEVAAAASAWVADAQ